MVTAEEFGNVVVRSNPDGSQVFLRDVARIELGTQAYVVSARLNQAPTASLTIYQLPDANGLDVKDRMEKFFEKRGFLGDLRRQLDDPTLGPLATLCHGDPWFNNMLFRHNADTGKPDEVILLDFQVL